MSMKHGTDVPEREDIGAVTVVRLKTCQVQDEDTLRTVFELIYKLIPEAGRNQMILNLAAADFLPSTGLGKLVMLNRKLQAANGRLALCQLTPLVQESLEHTRLIPLFNIYATEPEALQSFTEKGVRSEEKGVRSEEIGE
jgi:anti-sigma B factor antagonist